MNFMNFMNFTNFTNFTNFAICFLIIMLPAFKQFYILMFCISANKNRQVALVRRAVFIIK